MVQRTIVSKDPKMVVSRKYIGIVVNSQYFVDLTSTSYGVMVLIGDEYVGICAPNFAERFKEEFKKKRKKGVETMYFVAADDVHVFSGNKTGYQRINAELI